MSRQRAVSADTPGAPDGSYYNALDEHLQEPCPQVRPQQELRPVDVHPGRRQRNRKRTAQVARARRERHAAGSGWSPGVPHDAHDRVSRYVIIRFDLCHLCQLLLLLRHTTRDCACPAVVQIDDICRHESRCNWRRQKMRICAPFVEHFPVIASRAPRCACLGIAGAQEGHEIGGNGVDSGGRCRPHMSISGQVFSFTQATLSSVKSSDL